MENLEISAKWLLENSNQNHKTSIQEIITVLTEAPNKWRKEFEESIKVWINFVLLKLQSSIKEHKDTPNHSIDHITHYYHNYIKETQESVTKALINIEKLYMVPELKERSVTPHKSESKELFTRLRSSSLQKTRSSSSILQKKRKPEIFSMTKTHENSFASKCSNLKTATFSTVDSFSRMLNSHAIVTKHQKVKHNWEGRERSNMASEFEKTSGSISGNEVRMYFEKNEKNKENEIVEKVTSKLEEKLKSIQDGMTLQLKKIIETMEETKEQTQKHTIPNQKHYQNSTEFEPFPIEKEKSQVSSFPIQRENFVSSQNSKENKLEANLSLKTDIIKRNTLKNTFTNSIQDDCDLALESVLIDKSNTNSKIDKVEVCYENLQNFVNAASKVKLPTNISLIKLFVNSYLNQCALAKIESNLSKLELQKLLIDPNIFKEEAPTALSKQEFKESLSKLKILLTMDKFKEKVEKIKCYVHFCIVCGYDLVLHQNYLVGEDNNFEIQSLIAKL